MEEDKSVTVAFSLTTRETAYIAKVNEKHNFNNMSAALRLIVNEHSRKRERKSKAVVEPCK